MPGLVYATEPHPKASTYFPLGEHLDLGRHVHAKEGHSIDLSPSSPHAKRRIWQEAITTLLLTDARCAIPKSQVMDFAQARDSEYPPYLLSFSATPGERHVENLKVNVSRLLLVKPL